MNRIFILLLTIYLVVGCSNTRMELRDCLNDIKQKDEHYLIIDKKLKSMGFKYAQEFQPNLIYKYSYLGRTYYFELTDPKKNKNIYLNYTLFYEREKNKVDTYSVDILVPYLVGNYGAYYETDFNLSTIYSETKGIIKAKVWDLLDRRIYLLENFIDKSLGIKIDLLYIEIKETEKTN